MIARRILLAAGALAVGLATAEAQAPAITRPADVAGSWTGYVMPSGPKLELTVAPDGKFTLAQILLTQLDNSGVATVKDGALVLPLPVGGASFKLTPDGKLTGPYSGERLKGTATLTKK